MRIFVWTAIGVGVLAWLLPADYGNAREQKQRVIPGWGEVVDPAGDCTVEEANGTLTITVPGKQHNLNPLPGWNNLDAPRVLQDVDGDFVVQVLVRKFDMPKADTSSNKAKPASFVAGGLLVWKDGKNFLRYFRAANGERADFFVAAEFFSDGEKIASGGTTNGGDQDTYLRMSRKKGNMTLEESKNGNSWTNRKPPGKDIVLDGKVKVGVAVVNSTTKMVTNQFQKLDLKGK